MVFEFVGLLVAFRCVGRGAKYPDSSFLVIEYGVWWEADLLNCCLRSLGSLVWLRDQVGNHFKREQSVSRGLLC